MRIAVASLLLAMALRLGAAAGPLPVAAQTFTEITLPTPASRPSAITVGPDNALWFTEFGKIGRITTQGSITEFAIKGGGIFHLITTGPLRDAGDYVTCLSKKEANLSHCRERQAAYSLPRRKVAALS